MASPSAPSNQEAAVRKQRKGPPFKFLVPLIYAPVLPLIRITLKKNPVMRDRLFTLVLAGGFAHGLYLVYPFPFTCVPSLQCKNLNLDLFYKLIILITLNGFLVCTASVLWTMDMRDCLLSLV